MHLSLLTNNGNDLQSIVTQYMSTVQPYFPVISNSQLDPLIRILLRVLIFPCDTSDASSQVSLLFLSLLLITTPPAKNGTGLSAETKKLYTLLKTSIASFEANFEKPSTWMVLQARALVTLFEVGHNLRRAAWISVASLARAVEEAGGADGKSGEAGERLWWAVVVLDR